MPAHKRISAWNREGRNFVMFSNLNQGLLKLMPHSSGADTQKVLPLPLFLQFS